jgi:hypothetical protein
MEKRSCSQDLPGEAETLSTELNSDYGWGHQRPKATHLYDGTDSEGENDVISRKQTRKESLEHDFDLNQQMQAQLHIQDDPGATS